MNQHTAHETAAAIELREHAERLACTYAEPGELSAQKLGLLMEATEQEANSQMQNSSLIFVKNELIKEAKQYIKAGAMVQIDIGTTSKLVTLLGNILEGYVRSKHYDGEQE